MAKNKLSISILVPCYNEEKTLRRSISSWLKQTRPADEIIVVNDSSTDHSLEILEAYKDKLKIISLPENTGNKSRAQQAGLGHISGEIVVMTDADTILGRNFIKNIEKHFLPGKSKRVAAVAGYVRSLKYNWITACREIDYVVGFEIFKRAQSLINYIFVMPGCSTAVRTDVLKKLSFNHDTVTEDLDFTYQMHLLNMKIVFEKNAIVYTQDPPNLASYIRQMKRWYGGGWQNFIKYYPVAAKRPAAALELSLLFLDGFLYSIFLFALIFFFPVFFFLKILPLYAAVIFFLSVFCAFKRSRIDLVLVFPAYILIVFLNAWISISQFFIEVVFRRGNLVWLKADRV